jgi:hypothetical protein
MDNEPVFERSVNLPYGFVFTARARPSTVKRTLLRLLPWAVYMALPQGKTAKAAFFVATRVSPLMKQTTK